jgi:hypothetical protein
MAIADPFPRPRKRGGSQTTVGATQPRRPVRHDIVDQLGKGWHVLDAL